VDHGRPPNESVSSRLKYKGRQQPASSTVGQAFQPDELGEPSKRARQPANTSDISYLKKAQQPNRILHDKCSESARHARFRFAAKRPKHTTENTGRHALFFLCALCVSFLVLKLISRRAAESAEKKRR
jgi:hypothetical protein